MAIKVRRGKLYPPVEADFAQSLGLDETEWDKIVERLGRPPNQFECKIFATLWSEEVSNKSSSALLQAIERKMPEVKTVPGSKIGLIDIGEGTMLALRIVSNNKPTFLEPFYGAQTAMNSALEELTAVGARPLGLLNMLRFGNYDLIRNQRLFQGVSEGISAFGMKYGVPIVGGELYFHERYNGETMVNSGVVGIIQNTNALKIKEVPFQSPVLYVGAKTGLDGIKREATGDTPASPGALKISDPLLANRLVNACAEAIEAGVLRELVAVGHGGLAVAGFDLARRINRPIMLDIDRIPLRVPEMDPLDIILSESSDRVLMIIGKREHRELNRILHKWDLESVKVGEVNDADGIEFYWNHYQAADIPFVFAVEGAEKKSYEVVQFPPMLKRSAKTDDADKVRRRKRKVEDEWSLIREVAIQKEQDDEEREIECPSDLEDVWLDLMANPNLCSRSPMYRLFDQVVGANTIQRPGGDAAVLRLRRFEHDELKVDLDELEQVEEASRADQAERNGPSPHYGPKPERAIAVSLDSNSLYVSMEPYLGTVQTIAEGMRNLAAVGAVPCGLAYCMNFGNPESYKDVCDLAESIRGLGDASKIWGIPILSKQITLGHGTESNPILPTPAILMAGVLEDHTKMCTIGFKARGDIILLLGMTENEIGCSEYGWYTHRYINRLVPDIDFEKEKNTCDLIVSLINRGLLRSAHDLSAGGLAAALTESCLMRSRPIGCVFHIDDQVFETPNGPVPLRRDAALFSETSGRFLVSCTPESEAEVRQLCEAADVPITGRGTVGGKMLTVEGAAEIELPVSTTYKLWIHRLENLLGMGGEETQGFGAGS